MFDAFFLNLMKALMDAFQIIPMIGITFNLIIIRTHHTSLEYALPQTSNSISQLTTTLLSTVVSEGISEEV